MSKSLRDQLLGLGYAPPANPQPSPARKSEARPQVKPGTRPDSRAAHRPERKPGTRPDRRPERRPDNRATAVPAAAPATDSRGRRPPRSQQEIDLGKAYALRAQKEKDERIEAERLKQEEAKQRREAKVLLAALLKDKALNDPAAEIARHFEYGGKIKRIHVTAEQLKALNAGALGVAQMEGRYLLVPAGVLAEAAAIFPPAVALTVDPNTPAADDPYGDPAFQVPDDLVW